MDRHHDCAMGLDNARSNSEATPGSLPSPSRSKPARYGSSSGIPAPALHSPTSALHLPTPALRSDSRHSTLPANILIPYRPSQIPSSTFTPRSSSSSPSRSLFLITMRKETPQSRSLRKRAPNRNNENSHSLNVSPSNSSIAEQSALSSSRSKSYSSRSPVLQSPTPRTTTTTRQDQTPRSVAGDRGHYDTENESSSSPYAVANSESAKNGAKAALHNSRSRQSFRSPTKQSCSSAAPVQLSTLRTTDPSHNQTLWSRSGNTGHHGAQNVASGPLSTSPNLTNKYIASVTAPSAFQPPDSSPYQSGLTKGSSTSRGTFTKPMGENYSKPDEPKEKNRFSAFMSSTSLGMKIRIIEPLNEVGDSFSRIFIDPLRRNKNRK